MLRFTKMEGCGNDFLVVDLREHAPTPRPDEAAVAAALCDRNFGVGGDGVLAIVPASAPGAVARMRVLNADGSEAEMCGNGIRCVAKYLYERDGRARQPVISVETGRGVLECAVSLDKGRHVTHVAVEMGAPRLARGEIPMIGPAADRVVGETVQAAERTFTFTAVSMGNPHAVIFVDGDEPLRLLAETFGPHIEPHPMFPRKTNVEFARLKSPTEIELVVWERGCGITLACGTGACATAVAAVLNGRAKTGQEIAVHLPGGTLGITVADGMTGVTMRGPAHEVFDAEIDVATLAKRRVPGSATEG